MDELKSGLELEWGMGSCITFFDIDESDDCLNDISWIKLDKIKNAKDYTTYLKEISTNPVYETFNQLYFHAGDKIQFDQLLYNLI